MGRPSIPLFLNEARFVLLGAEINLSEISCVAINIDGEILARESIAGDFSNAANAISSLAKCVKKLQANHALNARTILGLGVGIPGPVDASKGLVLKAPSLGWENMPFLSLLQI